MELAYMVRGADGKDYGPVTLAQLTKWVQEGRLTPQQQVRRNDMQHWAAAGDFEELQPLFTPAATEATARAPSVTAAPGGQPSLATVAHMKSGASWFYWVAGLSLINSIAAFSGGSWRFLLGLGVTQIIDAFGGNLGNGGRVVALVLDCLAAGLLILLGVFANKGQTWAFIVGMVLFALDGVIFLLAPDWLGVAFHAFVLYRLFRGFSACRSLK